VVLISLGDPRLGRIQPFCLAPERSLTEHDKGAVRLFLRAFKQALRGDRLHLVERPENIDTLRTLGLTKSNCEDEILSLSVLDYSSGPDPDADRPGYFWVFGITIAHREVYIKLKLVELEDRAIARCLSFHFAREPLIYPFKQVT
jgi:hypothetical protein